MGKPPRFHTKPLRRRKRKSGALWQTIKAFITLLLVLAVGALFMRYNAATQDWQPFSQRFSLCSDRSSNACVIDGDTIIIGKRKIRLTGYNAPELAGECPKETALAHKSRDALLDWLNEGAFEMSGGDEVAYDQYGRELRDIRRGSVLLAEHMIAAELAQESGWGFVRGGWCE